ncbi:hypothetical protein [Acinetobacter guillouiae]|uniref:hypothetical protein n=1 Tax=Acinetobacter guillouiae TaxID=106649 RepID=UPI0021D3A9C8|nr:hypothetical protein [Acinetobacter guillouiae]MCU4491431.1 hypothetical protein [Acinetobacter guillouiae]
MKNKYLFIITMLVTCNVMATESLQTLTAPIASEQDQLNYISAPIKSLDNLYTYNSTTPKINNPIERLTPSGKTRFINSLEFSKTGLGSYSYTDLVNELSASEIYQILSLFGVQHSISKANLKITNDSDRKVVKALSSGASLQADRRDYWCGNPGTCHPRRWYICTQNC